MYVSSSIKALEGPFNLVTYLFSGIIPVSKIPVDADFKECMFRFNEHETGDSVR